jgi:hypothetical protein
VVLRGLCITTDIVTMSSQRMHREPQRNDDKMFSIFLKILSVTTVSLIIFNINSFAQSKDEINEDSCSFKGIQLNGKIQFVESFPDLTVQVVQSFPDLKVKIVNSFPDNCGEWQIVDSFPDVKVKIVESFADIKIKFVESFPGIP